jgi:hypothetical protein
MDDLIDRLKKLPPCKYHVHEIEVCQILQLKGTDGGASVRGKPSPLILAMRQGHAGCTIIDLERGVSHDFNIHLIKRGKKEAFATDRLATSLKVNHVPCWFSFGLDQMTIKKQLQILKSVTGEVPRMDKAIAERRKVTWLAWYKDKALGREFNLSHLPTIARQYCDEWEAKIPENDDRLCELIHIFSSTHCERDTVNSPCL